MSLKRSRVSNASLSTACFQVRYQLTDSSRPSTNSRSKNCAVAEHLQVPGSRAGGPGCRPSTSASTQPTTPLGTTSPVMQRGAPGARGRPRPLWPRPTPPLAPAAPSRPVSPEELPGGRGRRKPSENLGGGGMGDSKVKVAVRIRPMNRRGKSRARPGPPRRRRQVPGASLPSPQPPCGVRPAPPLRSASRRAGGRRAPKPRPPLARPACAGRPSPLPHRGPGAAAPRPGPQPLPPARPPRRPFALLPPLPSGRALRPWLRTASSFPRACPSARAPRPCRPLPAVSAASAPCSAPLRPGRDSRPPRPRVLARSPQPCTSVARGRKMAGNVVHS